MPDQVGHDDRMKSYLKFLSRNKLYTAIEFIGLAVSLAFVIIIGSYVWQQYAVTRENPDRERIYVPGLPMFPALTYGFPDVFLLVSKPTQQGHQFIERKVRWHRHESLYQFFFRSHTQM